MRTIIRNDYDPQPGDYHERIIIDETRDRRWLFDCDGVFVPFNETEIVNERGNATTKAVSQKLFTDTVESIEGDVGDLQADLADEIATREAADDFLQEEIDDIKNSPDVVDIVPTYAALQAYDTSKLGDKDIIRVLADETHDGQSTYYRWDKATSTWIYIGAVGPYYTKDQTDALLGEKQDTLTAGEGITINNNVISAAKEVEVVNLTLSSQQTSPTQIAVVADKTVAQIKALADAGKALRVRLEVPQQVGDFAPGVYEIPMVYVSDTNVLASTVIGPEFESYYLYMQTAQSTDGVIYVASTAPVFVGTDGTAAGVKGYVPAPAATDADKFLNADGTWKDAGGAEVVEITNITWTVDQFNPHSRATGDIGTMSKTYAEILALINSGKEVVAHFVMPIGMFGGDYPSPFPGDYYVEINVNAQSVSALMGTTLSFDGISSTEVMVAIDPSDPIIWIHNAYTEVLEFVEQNITAGSGAPSQNTKGEVGLLYRDTSNGKLYICTAVTPQGTTPETYTYTWEEVGGTDVATINSTDWSNLWQ